MIQTERVRPSKPNQPPVLWNHYSFYRPLERVDLPQATELKLLNRDLAFKALDLALRLVDNLNEEDKIKDSLEIAAVQAEIGVDTTAALNKALTYIKEKYRPSAVDCSRAATIAAFTGDLEKANELTELTAREFGREAWPYMSVARVLKIKGLDATFYLDKASELLDRDINGRGFPSLKAQSLARHAIDMADFGRDPEPWLVKSREVLEKSGQDESWAYAYLASAYAHFGRFNEAKVIAEKVKVEEGHSPSSQDALVWVARSEFEHGLIDQAIETARKANSPEAVSDLLLRKAYGEAKSGSDPEETLKSAIQSAWEIQRTPNERYILGPVEYKVSGAYSMAGRIRAMAGKNSEEMFNHALEVAGKIDEQDKKARAVKRIAIDIFYTGRDPINLVDALLVLDSKEKSPVILQEILEAALECGYYQYVDEIMKRLESYRNLHDPNSKVLSNTWSQNIDQWKINFLLMQAKIFGERSASTRDIILHGTAEDVLALINPRN